VCSPLFFRMGGSVSGAARVDELLEMSRKMKERLEGLQRGKAEIIDRLSRRIEASNEFLRAAGEIAKV